MKTRYMWKRVSPIMGKNVSPSIDTNMRLFEKTIISFVFIKMGKGTHVITDGRSRRDS